jgi:hypothetical protein
MCELCTLKLMSCRVLHRQLILDLVLSYFLIKQKFVRYSGLDLDPSPPIDERVVLHDDQVWIVYIYVHLMRGVSI